MCKIPPGPSGPGASSVLRFRAPGSLTLTSLPLLFLEGFEGRGTEDVETASAAAKPVFTFSSSTSKMLSVCTWFVTKVSRKVARLSMSRWWSRLHWELVRLRSKRSGAVAGSFGLRRIGTPGLTAQLSSSEELVVPPRPESDASVCSLGSGCLGCLGFFQFASSAHSSSISSCALHAFGVWTLLFGAAWRYAMWMSFMLLDPWVVLKPFATGSGMRDFMRSCLWSSDL